MGGHLGVPPPTSLGWLPDTFTLAVPDSGTHHVGFPQALVSPAASTIPEEGSTAPPHAEGTGGAGPAQRSLGQVLCYPTKVATCGTILFWYLLLLKHTDFLQLTEQKMRKKLLKSICLQVIIKHHFKTRQKVKTSCFDISQAITLTFPTFVVRYRKLVTSAH